MQRTKKKKRSIKKYEITGAAKNFYASYIVTGQYYEAKINSELERWPNLKWLVTISINKTHRIQPGAGIRICQSGRTEY